MANNHHQKEMPTGDGNPTAGEANNDLDCPTGQRSGKAFETLRAEFALHGYALFKVDHKDGPATYWAERCGVRHHLPTLDDARHFLAQIGVRL